VRRLFPYVLHSTPLCRSHESLTFRLYTRDCCDVGSCSTSNPCLPVTCHLSISRFPNNSVRIVPSGHAVWPMVALLKHQRATKSSTTRPCFPAAPLIPRVQVAPAAVFRLLNCAVRRPPPRGRASRITWVARARRWVAENRKPMLRYLALGA